MVAVVVQNHNCFTLNVFACIFVIFTSAIVLTYAKHQPNVARNETDLLIRLKAKFFLYISNNITRIEFNPIIKYI